MFFTEGPLTGSGLGSVQVKIGRQNSDLAEVKRRLAIEVKNRGGNALADFTYGQAARRWWKIGWDAEDWHGAGTAMSLEGP